MANYREPQWLLPNEKNLQYPAAGATQGSGLSTDRHSLYSMDFDGQNDYVIGPLIGDLIDLGATTSRFSISCWIKTTVTQSKGIYNASAYFNNIVLYTDSTDLYFNIADDVGS